MLQRLKAAGYAVLDAATVGGLPPRVSAMVYRAKSQSALQNPEELSTTPGMRAVFSARRAALLAATQLVFAAAPVQSADTRNLTGLPAYPNLTSALMDSVFRTDTLGHWCMRFCAATSDPLPVVESWYKKSMTGLSEVDLRQDKTYKNYPGVFGVKLVSGIDYVVVYKTGSDAPTSIDLYRCSPL
jgi:hypothetical protein